MEDDEELYPTKKVSFLSPAAGSVVKDRRAALVVCLMDKVCGRLQTALADDHATTTILNLRAR